MDLSFKNKISILDIEIFGYFKSFIGSCSSGSSLNKNSVFSHEVFALILMEIEKSLDIKSETLIKSSGDDLGNHG
jgi:hypothetical protein